VRALTIAPMGTLSRSQLLVYGAVGVSLLLVGARWIGSTNGDGSSGGVSFASGSGGSGGGGEDSFSVEAQGGEDVVVDVTGAVSKPGVYRLPAGSRVNDAVQRAGGATVKGDLQRINLAARLTDGQQVVIPARPSGPGGIVPGSAPGSGAGLTEPDGPISLGTATLEQLDTIEGIGPVTAQKILEFRDQHGGISSVDQLDQIDGIGPATMEALRSSLQP
jgi:competence protein ComEA